MTKKVIEIKNISKSFIVPHKKLDSVREGIFSFLKRGENEKMEVLKNISFDIHEGEFLGIIGRNGSGKSTLLKILAGVYEPDEGEIKVHGKISPFLELGVGFNGELTARENIFLNGSILGLSRDRIKEKFDKIIEFAELEKFVDTKVKNYSSGMYARLAFSVAIEADADIYLMDEVLAVGDSSFQKKCFEKFREKLEGGATVILVSHDLETIKKLSNRVALIRNGNEFIIGKPIEVVGLYYSYMSNNKKTIQDNSENNKAYITHIQIKNDSGNNLNIINYGEKFVIEVFYDRLGYNGEINAGVSIIDLKGTYIWGTNTFIKKVHKYKRKNSIIFSFNNCILNSGEYALNIGLWGSKESELFDYRNNILNWRVVCNMKTEGIVAMEYDIF